jgi:hypothetical protein
MPKKTILWSPEARADLRGIDRETALRVLHAIDSYLSTGSGDVKKLKPPRHEFRLRVTPVPCFLSGVVCGVWLYVFRSSIPFGLAS